MKKVIYVLCKNLMEREIYADFLRSKGYNVALPEVDKYTQRVIFPKIRKPGLVLIDLIDPMLNELHQLNKGTSKINIVAVGSIESLIHIMSFFKRGGAGFISYNNGLSEIETCVETVLIGQTKYYSPEVKSLLFLKTEKNMRFDLTSREEQVALLVKKGFSTAQIAKELNLSNRTIDVHRYNLMKKLQVKNVAGLVAQLSHKISA